MSETKNTDYLRQHYCIVAFLYFCAFIMTYKILARPEAQKDLITLLSSGAILATFGSAIASIGSIWQSDMLMRVQTNLDIFHKEIFKEEKQWKRWSFLPRLEKKRLLNGDLTNEKLTNLAVSLRVGSHIIEVTLPTVCEDFFDLPLCKNCWELFKNRTGAYTFLSGQMTNESQQRYYSELTPLYEFMAYKCIYDIWMAVLKFRIARYIIHLGAGLSIVSAVISGLYAIF